MLILGERHLRSALKEYMVYFNQARPHRGIQQRIPAQEEPAPDDEGRVVAFTQRVPGARWLASQLQTSCIGGTQRPKRQRMRDVAGTGERMDDSIVCPQFGEVSIVYHTRLDCGYNLAVPRVESGVSVGRNDPVHRHQLACLLHV